MEKSRKVCHFLRNEHETTISLYNCTPGHLPQQNEIMFNKNMYMDIYCRLFEMANTGNNPNYIQCVSG
jgi:hypothetical protein